MDNVSTQTVLVRKSDVILFSVQVSLIFIVVCASLVNLTYYGRNIELWTMILTSCLGYLMPNPRVKTIKGMNGSIPSSSDNLPKNG